MDGFQKYEKFLNKKRKKEVNGSATDDTQVIKEDYGQVKARFRVLQKRNMESPKLYLLPKGEQSLLRQQPPNSDPLNIDQLVMLLTRAITSNKAENMIWCCLKRCKFISRIVMVIVEGLGTDELADISDYTPQEVPSPVPNEEAAKNHVEEGKLPVEVPSLVPDEGAEKEEDKLPNGSSRVTEEVSRPPPTKRQKRGSLHGENEESPKERENPETEGQSDLLSHALPLSAPLFALHLNVKAPTQLSCDPIERLLSTQLRNTCLWRRYTKEYLTLEDAVEDKFLLRPHSKAMMLIENNFTPELTLTVKDHKDNMSRLDLLLSLQEMIHHDYPLKMQGNLAFQDPEFSHLHPVVEKVTPNSPMFGIDCEMCTTKRGSELSWISVIDEQLKVVYTNYVRPDFHIIDYLTKYSGVTEKSLVGVKTKLIDVQRDLRRLLPTDAILVGHHFSHDMKALKIFHPYVIDTSLIYNVCGLRSYRPSLKLLSKLFLDKVIQSHLNQGHNPSEDAAAAVELALLKLRNDATFGDAVKAPMLPFAEGHRNRESLKVFQARRESSIAPPVSAEYKIPLFKLVDKIGKDAALVTTEEGKKKVMPHIECEHNNLTVRVATTPDKALELAHKVFTEHKFLVCHCPMPENYFSSKTKAKAKTRLVQLDQRLAKLRESLPEKALMLTIFTGSSWSVPLAQRSNAATMLEVVGQERWRYFR